MLKILLTLALASCQVANVPGPSYPDTTPETAVDSTFRIETDGLDMQPLGYGTAWIAGFKEGYTYLVTAGHVCVEEAGSYKLLSRSGQNFTAVEVAQNDEVDLCLLKTLGNIGPVLKIVGHYPEYGAKVSYVGAPLAMWGDDGLAPIYEGRYIGGAYVSAPTAPGASGSAIFTEEGVFAVLITVTRRFDSITGIVPPKDLVEFLKLAGI